MEHESPRRDAKPIIGLAGGIGSGKSLAARVLSTLGAGVIDSDALGHRQLSDPEVLRTLTQWWGDSILGPDGQVNRRALGSRVFEHAEDRARLEALLHPRIARERETLIERFQSDPVIRAVVLDSPLLFETGLNQRCDAVLFVDADAEVRAQRASRRGWSVEEWRRRENLQDPLDKKRSQADYCVVNNSGEDELRHQVVRFFNRIVENSIQP